VAVPINGNIESSPGGGGASSFAGKHIVKNAKVTNQQKDKTKQKQSFKNWLLFSKKSLCSKYKAMYQKGIIKSTMNTHGISASEIDLRTVCAKSSIRKFKNTIGSVLNY